jgi:RNA polymerase sigma-70 factor (TIGR02943 family)
MAETDAEQRAAGSAADLQPESWVDAHGDALYRYAMMRLRDADAAEEAVQETFLAALKARERFSGRSSVRTWLVSILKHKIVDYIRKRTREKPTSEADASETLEGLEQELFNRFGHWRGGPAKWLVDPDEISQRGEFRDVFASCLQDLPARMADAFALRELDQQTSEEICKALGISETNLWVMLHRARLKLRGCLETNWLSETA